MKLFEIYESEGFKNAVQTYQKIQQGIGSVIMRLQEQLGPILEGVAKWGRIIGEYILTKDKLDNILLDCDWPPILHLPRYMMDEIIEAHDMMSKDDFENLLESKLKDWFTKDFFISLLDDWKMNPLLVSRTNLLEEAIKCHIEGNYYASVILHLSQVEGMVANGFYHSKNMNQKTYKRYLELIFSDNPTQKDNAIKEFILHRVLVQFHHGSPINSSLSRHAIMHGADVEFGTYLNSVKVILLIDYLQDYFGYVRVQGSNRYHIHGCHYLRSATKTLEVSKSSNKFEDDGCLPCSICIGHNDVS